MQHPPSPTEQLFIELINQARANPSAEAARQGTSLGNGVSATPSQPLAFSEALSQSAEDHSKAMLNGSFFNHVNTLTGATLTDRVREADYTGNFFGENLAWQGGFREDDETAVVLSQHSGLWGSLGHRQNFMTADYSEIGVGVEVGAFTTDGVTYPFSTMSTQNFGDTGKTYLTGVVIDDRDGDGFYDIGEGQGNVDITATNATGSFSTQSWDSGGYSLELEPGDYAVTFSGGDLEGSISADVTIAARNVKLDALEQDAEASTPTPAEPAEPEEQQSAQQTPDPVEEPIPKPEPIPDPIPVMAEETPDANACPYFEDDFEFSFNSGWLRKSCFFEQDFDTGRFANALTNDPDSLSNPLSDRGDGVSEAQTLEQQLETWWQELETCWA